MSVLSDHSPSAPAWFADAHAALPKPERWDPGEDVPWSMPIILHMPKDPRPSRTALLEAAATAVVACCLDERAAAVPGAAASGAAVPAAAPGAAASASDTANASADDGSGSFAAGLRDTPNSSASAVVTELMMTELTIAPAKLLPASVDSASRKLSNVMWDGIGLAENTNRLSRNAVTSIQ